MRKLFPSLVAMALNGPSEPNAITPAKSGTPTKKGPGRRPKHGKATKRRAPFHGPGSLMEYDAKTSARLRPTETA